MSGSESTVMPHVRAGNTAQDIGQRVEQREGQQAAEGSVAQPLELLAENEVFGAAVFQGEGEAADQIKRRQQRHPGAVQIPAHLHQWDIRSA